MEEFQRAAALLDERNRSEVELRDLYEQKMRQKEIEAQEVLNKFEKQIGDSKKVLEEQLAELRSRVESLEAQLKTQGKKSDELARETQAFLLEGEALSKQHRKELKTLESQHLKNMEKIRKEKDDLSDEFALKLKEDKNGQGAVAEREILEYNNSNQNQSTVNSPEQLGKFIVEKKRNLIL